MTEPPWDLRAEHHGGAVLGLTELRPRLSWKLPLGSRRQHAFEIQLDDDQPIRVDSDAQVLVPWPGSPLTSRRRTEWRVRVKTDLGWSPWAPAAWVEAGLLEPHDWEARWIEPFEETRSAHVLSHSFSLHEPVQVGRMYTTAHGIYECFLNDQRVGDQELAPGFTSYQTRMQVQAFDVTHLLQPGVNEWVVVLSDGWYRGRTGFRQRTDGYGSTLAFLGQLEADGQIVATASPWKSALGPLVSADLMSGQSEDHRRPTSETGPVRVSTDALTSLVGSPAPPVRRTQELRPVSVTRQPTGHQIVDLGQNINGWMRLGVLGPRETNLTLVHGETLDLSGDVTQANLLSEEDQNVDIGPFQTDCVIAAGTDDETFEPRQTTHGFRYVRIDSLPERATRDDVTGVVVHSDLRRTGWFSCSNPSLNRLHDIAEWSFRDNACDIPTDCPQRERSGWTGDWQIFVPTAAFLYDVAGFSLKWLRDLAAEQLPDGCIGNFAPDPLRAQESPEGYLRFLQGSSGWGDAIIMVPWELWCAYGDADILVELWPSMVSWLGYATAMARTQRHPTRVEARPQALDHEAFLWDGGFHWGEWLEPGDLDVATTLSADQGSVGTAYLSRSALLASRIGRIIGKDDEAARFEDLAHRAREAWRVEYVGDGGLLWPNSQATHVRALAFDLIPDELRATTADRLVALIREADTHLGTGFLATPSLLPVLADTGHLNLAYELLLRRTPPSWLAMVDRGATTTWELWEGVDSAGVAHESLNHYSKGSVISFLHRYVAGIQPDEVHPGYRSFRVAPRPGGGLSWARAVHDCPYGRIESAWRTDREEFELTVTVPPGTSAEVVLPSGRVFTQGPGTATHRSDLTSRT